MLVKPGLHGPAPATVMPPRPPHPPPLLLLIKKLPRPADKLLGVSFHGVLRQRQLLTCRRQRLRGGGVFYPPLDLFDDLRVWHIRLDLHHMPPEGVVQLCGHVPNKQAPGHGSLRVFRQGIVEFNAQHQGDATATEMLRVVHELIAGVLGSHRAITRMWTNLTRESTAAHELGTACP
jgi:hypothetical protein